MLGHFSLPELVVLFVIVLILFGPKRLPDLAASIGQSVRSFRQAMRESEDDPSPPKKEPPEHRP